MTWPSGTAGLTATELLSWGHCPGHAALSPQPWGSYVQQEALEGWSGEQRP